VRARLQVSVSCGYDLCHPDTVPIDLESHGVNLVMESRVILLVIREK